MSDYRLGQWPMVTLMDHAFKNDAASQASSSSAKKSILRIGQELSSMSTSLPVNLASSIFVVTDENRQDIIRRDSLPAHQELGLLIPLQVHKNIVEGKSSCHCCQV